MTASHWRLINKVRDGSDFLITEEKLRLHNILVRYKKDR
jgi:hypothetical protein